MLQVKSFSITDGAGISKLLEEYRLAAGASILVSDGNVCVPYEDGREATVSQKIAFLAEQKAQALTQITLLDHSQIVMKRQLADFQAVCDVAEHNHKKAPSIKELETKFRTAQNMVNQTQSQITMNDQEIVRLNINVEVFGTTIEALK